MFNPQGATYDHLKTLPNGMFIGGPVPFSNDISFNLKSPGLSDKRVRQAFIYALDRPSLLSAFFPDRARLANAAMKQDAWRNTALDNLYPFDAAKVNQLPQDANWDSRKQLNFITYHSDRNSKDLMAALQQAWQDVGINIKITFQDTATFVPAFYQKHQYDVAYIGGTGDYYPDALRPYASWGNMLNAAVSIEVIQSKPWIWIPPGLAVTLAVLAVNFVGDALRDAVNTRTILPH